mgnify:CR=1 FL=1
MMTLIDTVFGRVHSARPQAGVLARLNAAMALHRSRARLADLEPHHLADIGLTQKEAHFEANRPVWDVPATWKD